MIQSITTEKAPIPKGHYSQAIVHNGLVYISGQLSVDPITGNTCQGTIEHETLKTLTNLHEIVKAAGSSLDKILKVTVYISDMNNWGKVNKIYSEFFGNHKPARTIVPTRNLHYGLQIEIDAIAATN